MVCSRPYPTRCAELVSHLHLFVLVSINALWGFNFVAGKLGTEEFGPLLFITLRFAVVMILLTAFIRWVPGQMLRILAIGLCLGVGHYAFIFWGIHIAGSLSAVAITSQLTVPLTTILAILFLHERIGRTRAFAIAISFAGVVLLGFEPVGPEHLLALVLTTIASLAMAVATIMIRTLNQVAIFNLQAWIALIATVSMSLITWVEEKPTINELFVIPLTSYWTVVYSAVGATIIGHGLLYYLLRRYPVNNVAPFITLSTLFAMGFGVLFLDDVLTPRIIAGGLLTLLGVTIVAIRNAGTNTPVSISRTTH